jgi:hypothetical protein
MDIYDQRDVQQRAQWQGVQGDVANVVEIHQMRLKANADTHKPHRTPEPLNHECHPGE